MRMHGGNAAPDLATAHASYRQHAARKMLAIPPGKHSHASALRQLPFAGMRLHMAVWPDTEIPLLYACPAPTATAQAARAALHVLRKVLRGFALPEDSAMHVPWCHDIAVYRTAGEVCLWIGGTCWGRRPLPANSVWLTASTCIVAARLDGRAGCSHQDWESSLFGDIENGRAAFGEAAMSDSPRGGSQTR